MAGTERSEWEPVPTEEAIERLADAGLLTNRQAHAFVLRDIESVPRPAAAAWMGISPNTLDDRISEARRKIESAEATLEELEELRHRPLPEECNDCGATLGGRWTTDDAGSAICLECADV